MRDKALARMAGGARAESSSKKRYRFQVGLTPTQTPEGGRAAHPRHDHRLPRLVRGRHLRNGPSDRPGGGTIRRAVLCKLLKLALERRRLSGRRGDHPADGDDAPDQAHQWNREKEDDEDN